MKLKLYSPTLKSIRVGKVKYRIIYDDLYEELGEDLYGLSDGDNKIIWIDDTVGPKAQWKTLIHEILHCFEWEYGLKLKHKEIYALEKPILRLFFDNGFIKSRVPRRISGPRSGK